MAWESGKQHYKSNEGKNTKIPHNQSLNTDWKKRYKSRYLTSKPQISHLSSFPLPLFSPLQQLLFPNWHFSNYFRYPFSPFLLFGRLYLLSFNQLSNWIPLPFHLLFSSLPHIYQSPPLPIPFTTISSWFFSPNGEKSTSDTLLSFAGKNQPL